ncbi:MAG: 4Fe-4S dicluster domain-containing protein [Armatimonadota bacterium]
MTAGFLPRADFDTLLAVLRGDGWTVVGPTVRDGAVVLDTVASASELPIGVGDVQEAGTYRLRERGDDALFGFNLGPSSWKPWLHPPELPLMRIHRTEEGLRFEELAVPIPRLAFLGVRSCEVRGIDVLERVVAGGAHADPDAVARRANTLVIAVHCGQAAATCFCVSLGTGPRARHGFDLALGEIGIGAEHGFLVEVGSDAGRAIAERLPLVPATDGQSAALEAAVEHAGASMVRRLDTDGLREDLLAGLEDPHWRTFDDKCLSCGNCTAVCPTCFCTEVADTTDLAGATATRTRRSDSCFHLDHSRVHGGAVRGTTHARYRQWITHKLATWHDQFGESGCVGCGRCIAWCPVGIDIVAEAATIRARRAEKSQ